MGLKKDIIKERLKEAFGNDTQTVIGKKINVVQGTVSKVLSGDQEPTAEMLYNVAQVYDVSVDWLLGLTGEKKIAKQNMSYGDILKMFSVLGEKGALWPYPAIMHTIDDMDKELPWVTHVGIGDEILQSIMAEWAKMLQNPEDIYHLWLDKRLNEYSEIDYISWDEGVKKFFYECRPLQGVSHDFLKKFASAYKEKNCQGNETK